VIFFNEESDGTYTESMGNSGKGTHLTQQDLARFWQALHDADTIRRCRLAAAAAAGWADSGGGSPPCPKINRKPRCLRQKRHSRRPAARDGHLSSGSTADFDDNAVN
jgi:hypothetical protein